MIISYFYNIEKSVCTAFSLNVGTRNNNNTWFKINFRTYIIMIIFQETGRAATGWGGCKGGTKDAKKKCNCHYETKTKY